ncbi:hypothetical protein GCM10010116_61740 [Microbispora rosea subsp. aerata]|nr:hypothetical protein GCM10010116_61740 [Microbispora rosea subsp. aerata]GIH59164.1 hypothetical protein Mro02_60780 [Microbispora rosea subsp. aerata]GLJ86931.1 hypothetical protein GCM10017588_56740 [Microbispora rosea subsp. aerata]
MNLDSLVKRGHLPWRPNPRACDVDTWHEYEIPLSGTFRVGDNVILFTQVLESSHGLSAWAYTCLTPEQVDSTSNAYFSSVDELHQFVENCFLGKEAVLTLVRDDRTAGEWTRVEVTKNLVSAVEEFLNGIISSVDREPDTGRRVSAKLAGLEAATSELVNA